MPSTSTLMIAARVSKRRSMFIDSPGTQGMCTAWSSCSRPSASSAPPTSATPAGTSASG